MGEGGPPLPAVGDWWVKVADYWEGQTPWFGRGQVMAVEGDTMCLRIDVGAGPFLRLVNASEEHETWWRV